MTRPAVLLAAATLAAALAGEAAAASGGVVRAVVTGQHVDGIYRKPARLTIVRRGVRVLQAPVRRLAGARLVGLAVRDLDRDGEPEVVLDLFTGGAHCCAESLVYRYQPRRRRYVATLRGWGNAGYRLADLDRDRRPELVSADDRFSAAFTAYAASARPIRIWRFDHGRLLDVTRRFPRAVEADAATWWREYRRLRRQRVDVRGILAARAADLALLGRAAEAWGELDVAVAQRRPGVTRAYLRDLRTALERLGYLRG